MVANKSVDIKNLTSNELKTWFESVCRFESEEEPEETGTFTFVVTYRGEWCPFCMSYLKELHKLKSRIHQLGGKILIYAARKQETLDKMCKKFNWTFDYSLGDAEGKFGRMLKEHQLLDPYITGQGGDKGYETKLLILGAKVRGHEHGIVQPAVRVINRNMETMFKWRIDPKASNLQGATGRPRLKQIVDVIDAKVNGKLALTEITTMKELQKEGYKFKKLGCFDSVAFKYFCCKRV